MTAPPPGEDAPSSDLHDHLFRALAERGTDLALICDEDVVIRYAGPSLGEMFGYEPSDVVGVSGWDFVHPDDAPAARAHWAEALATPGRHEPFEVRVRHRDGRWLWIEERISNLLDDPAVRGAVVNIRDISLRRQAQDDLVARERFYESILSAAQEGIWVVDTEGRTIYANDTMAEFLGATREELLAGSLWDFYDEAAAAIVRERLATRARGVRERYELPVVRRDGGQRWLLVSAAPLTDDDGNHVASVGMSVDITDRKLAEQEMARLALYDSLTGLPNRSLLADRLTQLQDRHERTGEGIAVLFCDLDRFKLVNDNGGHTTGDELLVAVGWRLQRLRRDEDTVARFGGDEFVVLCPGADTWLARRLATDIQAAFREPLDLTDGPVTVSMSIGIATTGDVAPQDLFRAADRALYRAKANGRGRIEVHDTAMARSTEGRLQLLGDLRRAIDTNELQLHYQPIVHADGRVVGVEALLRWPHPELGPISPGDLIPLAEDHGLMPALGTWIINRACTDFTRLPVEAQQIHVAVNLSTRQLADGGIVETVRTALRESRLPASRLMLEVTETSVVDDLATTRPRLEALRELGVRLALDDFGTGYSSLTYLRRFPIDTIKIDRSFVAGMVTNADDYAIVASLTNLAATVGLDVVAEGVETEEQADLLRRLGCTSSQGYLWSPPVALADLPALLAPDRFSMALRSGRRRARPVPTEASKAEEQDRARILALHRTGASPATIAAALNSDGRRTSQGTRWHRNTVAQVIAGSLDADPPD